MDKKLVKEPDAHRYTLRIDGELASSVDYSVAGNSISFTHTFTNPKLRGQGFAADIVEFAVDDVESTTDYRVVPMCWYVGKWFDEHPERADLLTR
ncbi:MAG TPA: GNAT family N-acetyltransferase [Terrimesophilobacter sp.]|jgi:Predicted acetyltransferase|uniref:GNAT family N-acetyltransferase n=1 Tax=Terrimesophilobacter sp. TaxID=2906435 RepID=UPI002F94FF8C